MDSESVFKTVGILAVFLGPVILVICETIAMQCRFNFKLQFSLRSLFVLTTLTAVIVVLVPIVRIGQPLQEILILEGFVVGVWFVGLVSAWFMESTSPRKRLTEKDLKPDRIEIPDNWDDPSSTQREDAPQSMEIRVSSKRFWRNRPPRRKWGHYGMWK